MRPQENHSILSVKNPGKQLTFKMSHPIKENQGESSLYFPFLGVSR
jgi:hypothetical protein